MSGQAWRVGDRRAVGDQAAGAAGAAGEGRARHATTLAGVAGKQVGEQVLVRVCDALCAGLNVCCCCCC